jgi:hypothetical protein
MAGRAKQSPPRKYAGRAFLELLNIFKKTGRHSCLFVLAKLKTMTRSSATRCGYVLMAWATLTIFASCGSTRQIGSDHDKTANFNAYRSYAWIPQPDVNYKDNRYNNQIIENNIKHYTGNALSTIGLRLDTAKPDLLFSYELEIEKGERTADVPIYSHPHNFNMFWGNPMNPMMHGFNPMMDPLMGPMANQWVNPFGTMMNPMMMNNFWAPPPPMIVGYRTRQIPFKEGTVIITAIDRKKNRMVWRGWGISCIMDPYNFKRELEDKVNEIFKRYPG